jgi:hypothetical protein
MLHMLPTLLERLHEGCAVLATPMPEQDALFERLAMMHAAVARAGLRCRDRAEAGITSLASRSESDAAADFAMLNPPKPDTDRIRCTSCSREHRCRCRRTEAWATVMHFRGQGQARTLSLNWISPAGGMYLFGNDQGLEAMTLTRARLAQRFEQGLAALDRD